MTVDAKGDFIAKVERVYQGEVYGEALYNGIAEVMEDPGRAEKWRILTELEVVTTAFCDLELAGNSDVSINPARELIAKMRKA